MRSFKDTKDTIEILFKDRILKRFPNYAIFWEKFYGYKKKALPNLRAYGLKFPDKYSEENKQKVEEIYEEINVIYHHIFCSLAVAHFEMENYLENFQTNDPKGYFIRHSTFNSFYLNIGICRDMINRLIKKIIIDLANEKMRSPKKCKECGNPIEGGHLNSFEEYLSEKIDKDLAEKFKEWRTRISKIRARLSHYGSVGKLTKDEEFIPNNFTSDAVWSKDWDEIKKGNIQRVRDSLEQDLSITEELLNSLFGLFTEKFEEFLKKERISVDY